MQAAEPLVAGAERLAGSGASGVSAEPFAGSAAGAERLAGSGASGVSAEPFAGSAAGAERLAGSGAAGATSSGLGSLWFVWPGASRLKRLALCLSRRFARGASFCWSGRHGRVVLKT